MRSIQVALKSRRLIEPRSGFRQTGARADRKRSSFRGEPRPVPESRAGARRDAAPRGTILDDAGLCQCEAMGRTATHSWRTQRRIDRCLLSSCASRSESWPRNWPTNMGWASCPERPWKISLQQWAERDLTTAIEWVEGRPAGEQKKSDADARGHGGRRKPRPPMRRK